MRILVRLSLAALPLLVIGAEPSPAPDRVGFPANYASSLKLLGVIRTEKSPEFITAYGNDLAVSITREDQLPFPDGTVLMMEFANAAKDANGATLRDAGGQLIKGDVVRVDVMRRGSGFGVVYGESRAGEWEFASYNPDGTTRIPPDKAVNCAACHRKVGAAKDFVHRVRVPEPTATR